MTPERFAKICETLNFRQPDMTVVMDGVHKPRNLAAIARTAEAVGIGSVHAVSEDEDLRLTQKAATGSTRWMDVNVHSDIEECTDQLKRQGLKVFAAHFDENAKHFREVDYTQPFALLVGQELEGISERALSCADQSIIIPMQGMVEALNVSVAAALVLYEAQRQRELAGFYDEPRLSQAERQQILFEWCQPKVAEYCRKHGLEYPPLDDQGVVIGSIPTLNELYGSASSA